MTVASKAAGFSFFALGLIARRAMAVDQTDCEGLRTAVAAASAAASFTLGADFSCTEAITITGKTTIEGGSHTITIDPTFLTAASSIGSGLFVVEAGGTLEINDVTITVNTEESDGVRAIYNEGTLTVYNCVFSKLNTNVPDTGAFVDLGAAIYTKSDGNDITITGSTFVSNVVTSRGGAICADATDFLTVSGCVFTSNEAGLDDVEDGSGGDIYAARGVTLTVEASNFTQSTAYYGGAAIECCGAVITDSQFTATESAREEEHYGALLVGRPGEAECPRSLEVTNCDFTRCTVSVGNGAGGSMAIFDTSAEVVGCTFEQSQGTAVLFQSSDANTYQLEITSSHFYSNSNPAKEFSLNSGTQGTALAIQNTGLGDGEEPTEMGKFINVFCFENEPYECEFVYHDAIMVHEGEFKCQICDEDGERQDPGTDDFLSGTDRDISSGSDSSDGIVIGLSLALGLTLVVIGALAVWKFRVRKNARRLMEDMGEGDL